MIIHVTNPIAFKILIFVLRQFFLFLKRSTIMFAWVIPFVFILMSIITWLPIDTDLSFLSHLSFISPNFSSNGVINQDDLLKLVLYISTIGGLLWSLIALIIKIVLKREFGLNFKTILKLSFLLVTFVYLFFILGVFIKQGFDFGMLFFTVLILFLNYISLFVFWLFDRAVYLIGVLEKKADL